MEREEILSRLRVLRDSDPFYRDGKIISSVYTNPDDIAMKAFEIYADVNLLDSFIYKNAEVLEKEVIDWLGELYRNSGAAGYISSGGTESNLVALYAAKKMYPGKSELIVPESAHYSIDKAADLMGLSVKRTGLDENFRADPCEIRKSINDKTLAVVATAGTSSIGAIDPIEEINELCGDVYLHVDAAFAGFVLPFLEENKNRLDFSLENIDSISTDPHKMGLSLIPAGAVLFRDESYMDKLRIDPSYIPVSTYTLSGTRSAGPVAATWATIKLYGMEGYRKIVTRCMENMRFLCEGIGEIPGAEIVAEPEINIAGIRFDDLSRVSEALEERGWIIAVNEEMSCLRFVVMPHVTRDVISEFLKDLKEILQ